MFFFNIYKAKNIAKIKTKKSYPSIGSGGGGGGKSSDAGAGGNGIPCKTELIAIFFIILIKNIIGYKYM